MCGHVVQSPAAAPPQMTGHQGHQVPRSFAMVALVMVTMHRHITSLEQSTMKDNAAAEAFFTASTRCMVRNGESTIFCLDPWLGRRCIQNMAPELWEGIPGRMR
jgi:hypothetical protein